MTRFYDIPETYEEWFANAKLRLPTGTHLFFNGLLWIAKHPRADAEMLGILPRFLSEKDPRPAREQLDKNYRHGGGWTPQPGFAMVPNGLMYPGDPRLPLIFETRLRDETIRFYEFSFLAIVQLDGSFEACRMD